MSRDELKVDTHKYVENFLFRTRTHTLLKEGVRTEQNSFLNSSDIITKYHQIGSIVQYRSELKLSEIITSIVLFLLGLKGLSNSSMDEVLFAISIIFIAVAVYWLIQILFNLEYVGSFYFSESVSKNKNTFEIKSRYPASEELLEFSSILVKYKKNAEINYLAETLSPELTEDETKLQVLYLKNKYLIDDFEFEEILKNIRNTKKIS